MCGDASVLTSRHVGLVDEQGDQRRSVDAGTLNGKDSNDYVFNTE
jgi:hypothetical protein